jgi:Sec-independent protein translocase protein TatA
MELLGIGLPEILAILLILFIVLGPQDLVKLGGTLGRAVRSFRQSGAFQSLQDASRQLRSLPETLARQAGLEDIKELQNEIKSEVQEQRKELDSLNKEFSAWTRQPDPLSQKKQQPPAPPADPEPPSEGS